jgi:hypothetical protein
MNKNFVFMAVAAVLAIFVITWSYTGGFWWLFPTPASESTTRLFCKDTDGRNYFVRGTCSDYGGNYTDYCYGNTTCVEYYCPTNISNCTREYIDCRNVGGSSGLCINGACQRQQQQTCYDSDGKNYFTRGTCTDMYGNYTDYCINNNTCREYFCPTPNSTCTIADMDCRNLTGSNGLCSNGACQKQQQYQALGRTTYCDNITVFNLHDFHNVFGMLAFNNERTGMITCDKAVYESGNKRLEILFYGVTEENGTLWFNFEYWYYVNGTLRDHRRENIKQEDTRMFAEILKSSVNGVRNVNPQWVNYVVLVIPETSYSLFE